MISFGSDGHGALGRETSSKYDFINDENMKNEKIVTGCANFYGSILLCFSKETHLNFMDLDTILMGILLFIF